MIKPACFRNVEDSKFGSDGSIGTYVVLGAEGVFKFGGTVQKAVDQSRPRFLAHGCAHEIL